MPIDDILKTITPWVTGGLAGAILTLLSKTVTERRQQKRLSISTAMTPFALPEVQARGGLQRQDLQVMYKGNSYDDLFLYSVVATNIGNRSLEGIQLVLLGAPDLRVLSISTYHTPVGESRTDENYPINNLENHVRVNIALPKLEKNDACAVNILAHSSNKDIQCIHRDADDVRVVSGANDLQRERETNVVSLTLFGALFLLADSIPLIGGVVKALILVISAPTLRKIFERTNSQKSIEESYKEFELKRINSMQIYQDAWNIGFRDQFNGIKYSLDIISKTLEYNKKN